VGADGKEGQHSKRKECDVIMNSKSAIALVVSVAICAGCRQPANSTGATDGASADASPNEAVRMAIQAHIAHNGNLDLKAFDTDVKQVTIDRDHAQAEVEFHVKKGSGAMQLTYQLEKRNGAWAVVESQPLGSNFSHPALNKAQTPATGSTSSDPAIFRALDNFHGSAATPPQNLPPGHPPIAPPPKSAKPETPKRLNPTTLHSTR
jgi:hypothetical protein